MGTVPGVAAGKRDRFADNRPPKDWNREQPNYLALCAARLKSPKDRARFHGQFSATYLCQNCDKTRSVDSIGDEFERKSRCPKLLETLENRRKRRSR